MPPRQRALTIVLSFPAPRTNWSCAATHGLASGPSARRTGAGQPCRVRRSARGYPRVRHSYQTLRIGRDMRAFGPSTHALSVTVGHSRSGRRGNGMVGRPAGADGSRSSGRGQARVPV